MNTNANVNVLPKLHEEDGSCIIDGGHLPYQIQVEHHDVGKTLQIRQEISYVETFLLSNTTNMGLEHLYGEHFVLEVSEVMFYISKSKNLINVLHFNGEFMASYLTIYNIISQDGIGIEFSNQWFTNPWEITQQLFPTSFHKTAWDEAVLDINKIHKSLLNDWGFHKVLVVSLKMQDGVKPSLIHVFPLVTTLSRGFLWSHL